MHALLSEPLVNGSTPRERLNTSASRVPMGELLTSCCLTHSSTPSLAHSLTRPPTHPPPTHPPTHPPPTHSLLLTRTHHPTTRHPHSLTPAHSQSALTVGVPGSSSSLTYLLAYLLTYSP